MEEIINEQMPTITTQAVETEEVKGEEGSISYGKFKSAEALLSAYNSLQAEFTKRCQRIKELEAIANNANALANENSRTSAQGTTQLEKENILKDYLIELERGKSNAIVMENEGVSVKTPYTKPKTIAEAGKLANDILKKQ